eukprot:403363735
MLLARIAEQSEQYDDMIEILKPFFESKTTDLTVEERNILCLAYKNAVGTRRIAWRAASAVTKLQKYSDYQNESSAYRKKLEEEVVNMCKDMIKLAKTLCTRAKKDGNTESQIYYHKLQGDYLRYVAEVGDGERLQKAMQMALDEYNKGIELAEQLSPADPTRLSLLLNYSVFCYETVGQKDQAIEIANQSLEDAIQDIDQVDKAKAQESATILEFIKLNIDQWNSQKGKSGKNGAGVNGQTNLFSQNDSEAQFINQEDYDDDEDEEY